MSNKVGNPKPCPICDLGDQVCNEINRRFAIGLPASEVVGYLGGLGHKRTQRDLINHRRHVVALKSPRTTGTTEKTTDSPEVSQRVSMASGTLSDREREERLLEAFLTATENMLASLAENGSIKISRAAVELGSLAYTILNGKLGRETLTDPVINIIMQRTRLEDVLEKAGSYKPDGDYVATDDDVVPERSYKAEDYDDVDVVPEPSKELSTYLNPDPRCMSEGNIPPFSLDGYLT